jgi:hypothetical protein
MRLKNDQKSYFFESMRTECLSFLQLVSQMLGTQHNLAIFGAQHSKI